MSIVQPRLDHIATATLSRKDLLAWGENEVAPAASKAAQGEGELRPGQWCRFCKVKGACTARAQQYLDQVRSQRVGSDPALMPDEDIESVLIIAKDVTEWAKHVEDYARSRLMDGHRLGGLKLVKPRGRRVFTDPEAVAQIAEGEGIDPYDHRLKALTRLEKAMGKKVFNARLGEYVTTTDGEPQLALATDPRAAWDPTTPDQEFKKVS